MSAIELIDELAGEANEEIRSLLRRAYDHGFREGLASTGKPLSQPTAADPEQPSWLEPPHPAAQAPAAQLSPVAWSSEPAAKEQDDEDSQGQDEATDNDDDTSDATIVRPILPLATVGTLRRRINRTFDLERFDIDVVICRAGDSERRQLKSSVRLSSYRKEEG